MRAGAPDARYLPCALCRAVSVKTDDKIHRNNSLCVVTRDCGTEPWNGQDPPTLASRRSKEKPTLAAAAP